MKFRRSVLPLAAIVLSSLFLGGCSGFRESITFEKGVAVKIPLAAGKKPEDTWTGKKWAFQFIALGPREQGHPPSAWYLARNIKDTEEGVRLKSPGSHWRYAERNALPIADEVYARFHKYPTVIEPNLVFKLRSAEHDPAEPGVPDYCKSGKCDAKRRPIVSVNTLPSWCWPFARNKEGKILPVWHLDDQHTELATARIQAREQQRRDGTKPVRIGILDTGFSAGHATAPRNVEDDRSADVLGRFGSGLGRAILRRPGTTNSSHGTGTISILAGPNIVIPESEVRGRKIAEFQGELGAAPDATIVPVRIAPNVFSLATANMASGIDYASRKKECDVISMSHGGAPSLVWADAVNAAYDRGTAIFAANGNFFSITGSRGVATPSYSVYPAAFYRVVGVTGITADGQTYAKNPASRFLGALARGDFRSLSGHLMRGCYGGDGSARLLWQRGAGSSRLRNNPIAAYTPNMPWANSKGDNLIELDGAGTSSATPQVAGAAALWLQYNRRAIEKDRTPDGRPAWNSWKKVEAVYTALIANAERKDSSKPDFFLGAGVLKASRAINDHYDDLPRKYPKIEGSPLYYGEVDPDLLDGQRTLMGMLTASVRRRVDAKERLQLLPQHRKEISREKALHDLYYNFFLVCDWHRGVTPTTHEKGRLDRRASNAVKKALAENPGES